MINKNALPDNFSGVMEFKKIIRDHQTGIRSVDVYITHNSNGHQFSEEEYGHFLEKKALKEKLESSLGEKGSSKRGKI